ncbi:exodeoxyribonuclease V subunit gamma [Mannheimia granulomatis]|uniref:RecBCD enzyme subunit RecC n=1 Tax=Mannheimia granulomatis TaxID=85402 RepID=A0A6G8JK07_9PAST|nr:exodeoxyribonuclease V subunit gamma [Mannheimia granulomatis]QIM67441.1 exodeoxyribonuclease V subunit gamma [Mannheimia granulomatis]
MFTLYQSNKISSLAEMLVKVQQVNPLEDPFEAETILIQSQGMAQWLQMQIAEFSGIMGNCEFLYPTTFLWQQYRLLFPELPKENIFERSSMAWRIMRLLPNSLSQPEFESLKHYLAEPNNQEQYQLKLYQLSDKIAELFDQYLVYRPHWLLHWEEDNLQAVENELKIAIAGKHQDQAFIFADMKWQSILWKQLVNDLKADADSAVFMTSHRGYLQQNYFDKLDNLTAQEKARLPKRIAIFGISAFSPLQLAVFKKLSEHCDIHIFFLNPSEKYWGDSIEDKVWQKLALTNKISTSDLENLLAEQSNKLLNLWGKQGRDFLAQLMEFEPNTIDAFVEPEDDCNLNKIKKQIFSSENQATITELSNDHSIQIHACHSPMREVEVLHNQLLNLFEKDKTLLPKDIMVMSPDINKYAPYIDAVFSRYAGANRDPRYIPFSLSDQAFTQIDPIIASFLQLLAMKESDFKAEDLFDLLEINAIAERFHFNQEHIHTLRTWAKKAGIRAGLDINRPHWQNYNSWENGLNRLLLGSSLKEENGIWENTLAFGDSYGLNAELVGGLADFISHLLEWVKLLQQPHSLIQWHQAIRQLIASIYHENAENTASILLLNAVNDQIFEQAEASAFSDNLQIEIIELLFNRQLNQHAQTLNFLVGRVNFATLLPMRAIPFKVVCLLGMNEADFPRQQQINSFDLMQYAPQKGDRAKRDDDRYLFLEALLSAQKVFYISYVGQSQKDGKEMLPSILVSQLLDVIDEYLVPELRQVGKASSMLVRKQPLTVFSKKNFTQPHDYAYNAEWIIPNTLDYRDFLNEPLQIESMPHTLEIGLLIRFLQNPVKYFFHHVLGVTFEQYDNSIEETEIFAMSGLERYDLLEDLLPVSTTEQATFFEKEKLKGNLPASNFAEMAKQDLLSKISEIRQALSDYLVRESAVLAFSQPYFLSKREILLTANIANIYGDDIVLWRVGGLRDKDRIQAWIYHLLMTIYQPNKKVKFYYRNGEQAGLLYFDELSREEADEQFTIYLNAYLQGLSQVQLVIYGKLSTYFNAKVQDPEKTIADLAEDRDGAYLTRILRQSRQLDYGTIHQTTLDWFSLMHEKTKLEN